MARKAAQFPVEISISLSDTSSDSERAMLRRLSNALQIPLGEISISYKGHLNLFNFTDTNIILAVLESFRLDNPTSYRGFYLHEALTPKSVFVVLNTSERVDPVHFEIIFFQHNPAPTTLATHKAESIEKYTDPTFGVNFHQNQQEGLFQYIESIDQYYTLSEDLRAALYVANSLVVSTESNLNQLEKTIQELQGILAKSGNAALIELLHLKENDPLQYLANYRQLTDLTFSLDRQLDLQKNRRAESLVNVGIDSLMKGNKMAAKEHFHQALEASSDFGPAYIKLAQLNFMENHFLKANRLLMEGLHSKGLDQSNYLQAKYLAEQVQDKLILAGREFINSGRVELGQAYLESAREICTLVQAVDCGDGLGVQLSESHQLNYNQLLDRTEYYLNNQHFELAKNTLNKANNYRCLKSKYIKDSLREMALSNTLISERNLFAVASVEALEKDHKFQEAYQLVSNTFPSPKNEETKNLQERVYKTYADYLLIEAKKEVQKFQEDKARLKFAEAKAIAASVGYDPEGLSELRKDLMLSCEKSGNSYLDLYLEAQNHFENNHYYLAAELYQQAIAAVELGPDYCAQSSDKAREQLESLKTEINYGNQIKQAAAFAEVDQPEAAINLYLSAQTLLTKAEQEKKISADLVKWVISIQNPSLLKLAINLSLEDQQINAAIDLLKIGLEQKYFGKNEIKTLLENIAVVLAREKHLGNPYVVDTNDFERQLSDYITKEEESILQILAQIGN